MKHNMGKVDRLIRTILAVVIAYALITGAVGGPIAWILGVVGVLLVVTTVFGYCPAYGLFGINTCKCDQH